MSRNEIGFRFDGLTVRVSSRDRTHLAWLEEFLTPWFETVPAGEAECEVAIVADEAEYARRLEIGPPSDGATAHCFALDSGAVRLPLWPSSARGRVVFDRRLRAFYEVGESPRRVEVLVRPDDLSVRFAAMRIVRELAQERSRAKGCLLLHAAALSLDGRTFVIAGAKGAGKTSLLVASLLGKTGRVLSNDRIVVGLDAEGVFVHGVPTLVSIRPPTLEAYPELRRRLEWSRYHHLRALEEAGENPGAWRAGRVADLSPAQFSTLLGVGSAARGRMDAMLFLHSYAPGAAVRLGLLDADAVAERVSSAVLGGAAANDTAESFFSPVLAPPAVAPSRRDVVEELTRMPSFEVRREAVESGGVSAHEILRGLTE